MSITTPGIQSTNPLMYDIFELSKRMEAMEDSIKKITHKLKAIIDSINMIIDHEKIPITTSPIKDPNFCSIAMVSCVHSLNNIGYVCGLGSCFMNFESCPWPSRQKDE